MDAVLYVDPPTLLATEALVAGPRESSSIERRRKPVRTDFVVPAHREQSLARAGVGIDAHCNLLRPVAAVEQDDVSRTRNGGRIDDVGRHGVQRGDDVARVGSGGILGWWRERELGTRSRATR